MLAVITVLCLYLGWAMNWKRERHNFLQVPNVNASITWPFSRKPLPFSLRLVGERYCYTIQIHAPSNHQLNKAKQLFPEAVVYDPAVFR